MCTPRPPASPSPASTCPARRSLHDALGPYPRTTPPHAPADRVLLGHGWDATALARAAPPRPAPNSTRPPAAARSTSPASTCTPPSSPPRCSTSSPASPSCAGFADDAPLTGDAHHAVRAAAHGTVTPDASAPRPSAPHSPTPPRSASAPSTSARAPTSPARTTSPPCSRSPPRSRGPRVVGYWAEPVAVRSGRRPDPRTRRRRRRRATSSSTARSARTPPACTPRTPTPPHTGTAYLDADAVAAHVAACTEAGLQAGFHAIGDAAVTAVVEGVRAAAETRRPRPGPRRPAPRRARRDAHPRDHRRLRRARPHRLRPARLRRGLGRRRTACTPSGSAPSAPAPSTRTPRCCAPACPLAFGSDSPVTPARPLGHRPCRRLPPHARAPHLRARRVHRAHPRRLAGRRPRRRGRPGARRTRRLRASGAPANWSSRPPTTGSPAGRPTRAPAPPACPT